MRAKFGTERIQQEVSGYYIANEVQSVRQGMNIAIAESEWVPFQLMPTKTLSRFLLNCAEHIELGKYKRHPRGPKKPVPKRTKYVDKMHVSTARLLAAAKTRKKSR